MSNNKNNKINPNDPRYDMANNPSNPYSPAYQYNPKVLPVNSGITPNDPRYDIAKFDTNPYGPAAFERYKQQQNKPQNKPQNQPQKQTNTRPREDPNHKFNIPQQQNQIGKNYTYDSKFNPKSINESKINTNLEESKEEKKNTIKFSNLSIHNSEYISNSEFEEFSKPQFSIDTKKQTQHKK